MKRTAAAVAAFILAFLVLGASAEDVDLSFLNYEDLILLSSRIREEIMSRPEWKEAVVPQGVYIVGEDLPAGKYSVYVDPEETEVRIDVLKADAEDWEIGTSFYFGSFYGETSANFTFREGDKITVVFGSALFRPFTSLF